MRVRPEKVSRIASKRLEERIEKLEAQVRETEADRDHAMRMLMALVHREGRVRFTKAELEAVSGAMGIDFDHGLLGLTVTVAWPAKEQH